MANFIFNSGITRQFNGNAIDFDTDTIKIALLGTGYTPDQDAHDFFDDVSANEISATGYTAGGATLASVTVTQDNTNNGVTIDATDPTWTITTAAAPRYAVIYKSTGTASTSALFALIDLLQTYNISNGTFTINFDAVGIFYAR